MDTWVVAAVEHTVQLNVELLIMLLTYLVLWAEQQVVLYVAHMPSPLPMVSVKPPQVTLYNHLLGTEEQVALQFIYGIMAQQQLVHLVAMMLLAFSWYQTAVTHCPAN